MPVSNVAAVCDVSNKNDRNETAPGNGTAEHKDEGGERKSWEERRNTNLEEEMVAHHHHHTTSRVLT